MPAVDQENSLVSAWIPCAPSSWRRIKLGFVTSIKARLGWKGLKAEEYVDDGYVFLSTPNIKGREIDFQNVNYISEPRYLESPEIMLQKGDVLIAKDGSTLGITNVVRHLPRPATVNSSIAVIRPGPEVNSIFLCYFLQSHFFQSVIQRTKGGMGVPHLFQADLRKFDILLPPLEMQARIADVLDRRTAAIDEVIRKKEAMIRLVEDRKQAELTDIISHGTVGSQDKVRASTIWASAPRHWHVIRLGLVLRRLEQGWSPECLNREAEEGEWGVLKAGCVNTGVLDEKEHKTLPPWLEPELQCEVHHGDVLMSRASGSPKYVGSVGIARNFSKRLLFCDKLYRLQFDLRAAEPAYFVHVLRSAPVRQLIDADATGQSTLRNIGQDFVRSLPVPVPPLEEQERLLPALDSISDTADRQIELIKASLGSLSEYRVALITAAVTGQTDIPALKDAVHV